MSDFQREARYYVIKIKDLSEDQDIALCDLLSGARIPCTDCVVVESDWPNYEHTWNTVEKVVASGSFVDPYKQLEQAQARVAELRNLCERLQHCAQGFYVDQGDYGHMDAIMMDYHGIMRASGNSQPFIKRKQAEALEHYGEALGMWLKDLPGSPCASFVEGVTSAAEQVDRQAQRLRDEAEKAGGEQ